MFRMIQTALAVFTVLASAALPQSRSPTWAAAVPDERLNCYVSILPQAYWLRRWGVAGSKSGHGRSGTGPHTYEPTGNSLRNWRSLGVLRRRGRFRGMLIPRIKRVSDREDRGCCAGIENADARRWWT